MVGGDRNTSPAPAERTRGKRSSIITKSTVEAHRLRKVATTIAIFGAGAQAHDADAERAIGDDDARDGRQLDERWREGAEGYRARHKWSMPSNAMATRQPATHGAAQLSRRPIMPSRAAMSATSAIGGTSSASAGAHATTMSRVGRMGIMPQSDRPPQPSTGSAADAASRAISEAMVAQSAPPARRSAWPIKKQTGVAPRARQQFVASRMPPPSVAVHAQPHAVGEMMGAGPRVPEASGSCMPATGQANADLWEGIFMGAGPRVPEASGSFMPATGQANADLWEVS